MIDIIILFKQRDEVRGGKESFDFFVGYVLDYGRYGSKNVSFEEVWKDLRVLKESVKVRCLRVMKSFREIRGCKSGSRKDNVFFKRII